MCPQITASRGRRREAQVNTTPAGEGRENAALAGRSRKFSQRRQRKGSCLLLSQAPSPAWP